LERLVLDSNEITSIDPLKNCKNLWSLSLNFNKITDLTPLKQLPKLEYLRVDENPVPKEHYLEFLDKYEREVP